MREEEEDKTTIGSDQNLSRKAGKGTNKVKIPKNLKAYKMSNPKKGFLVLHFREALLDQKSPEHTFKHTRTIMDNSY